MKYMKKFLVHLICLLGLLNTSFAMAADDAWDRIFTQNATLTQDDIRNMIPQSMRALSPEQLRTMSPQERTQRLTITDQDIHTLAERMADVIMDRRIRIFNQAVEQGNGELTCENPNQDPGPQSRMATSGLRGGAAGRSAAIRFLQTETGDNLLLCADGRINARMNNNFRGTVFSIACAGEQIYEREERYRNERPYAYASRLRSEGRNSRDGIRQYSRGVSHLVRLDYEMRDPDNMPGCSSASGLETLFRNNFSNRTQPNAFNTVAITQWIERVALNCVNANCSNGRMRPTGQQVFPLNDDIRDLIRNEIPGVVFNNNPNPRTREREQLRTNRDIDRPGDRSRGRERFEPRRCSSIEGSGEADLFAEGAEQTNDDCLEDNGSLRRGGARMIRERIRSRGGRLTPGGARDGFRDNQYNSNSRRYAPLNGRGDGFRPGY